MCKWKSSHNGPQWLGATTGECIDSCLKIMKKATRFVMSFDYIAHACDMIALSSTVVFLLWTDTEIRISPGKDEISTE